jgi:hypothetical protein
MTNGQCLNSLLQERLTGLEHEKGALVQQLRSREPAAAALAVAATQGSAGDAAVADTLRAELAVQRELVGRLRCVCVADVW